MITKSQAQTMRLRILAALDTDDKTSDRDEDGKSIVDIDRRFIEQIFADDIAMANWCRTWNIAVEAYEIPHAKRSDKRSKWVRFKKPEV